MPSASQWFKFVQKEAAKFNATVDDTGKHLKISGPTGWIVFASRSPSDCCAQKNLQGDLRRYSSRPALRRSTSN